MVELFLFFTALFFILFIFIPAHNDNPVKSVKNHIIAIKHIHWGRLRNRDIAASVAALVIIILIELAWPASVYSGRVEPYKRSIKLGPIAVVQELGSERPQIAKYNLTLDEASKLSGFLNPLTKRDEAYWDSFIADTKADIAKSAGKLEKQLKLIDLEYEETLQKVRDKNGSVDKISLRTSLKFRKKWLISALESEKNRYVSKLEGVELGKKLFSYTYALPHLDEAINVISNTTSKFLSIEDVKISGSPREIPLFSKIYRNLLGEIRSHAGYIGKIDCYIGIYHTGTAFAPPPQNGHNAISAPSGTVPYAARHCDIVVPIIVHYDVTAPQCPLDTGDKNSAASSVNSYSYLPHIDEKNTSAGCIERWTLPSLLIRADEQGLLFYPPRSDNHHDAGLGLRDEGHSPLTVWSVVINNQTLVLDHPVRLPWQKVFDGENHELTMSIIHNSREGVENLRWWQDFDVEVGFFGNGEKLITSAPKVDPHKFTGGIRWLRTDRGMSNITCLFGFCYRGGEDRTENFVFGLGRTADKYATATIWGAREECPLLLGIGYYLNPRMLRFTHHLERHLVNSLVAPTLGSKPRENYLKNKIFLPKVCAKKATAIRLLDALAYSLEESEFRHSKIENLN
ncbi:MAG: hypothetical protein COA52_05395 [Hyphomicrobiales bacterium]|nr:hypothetical protein [Hyphomicrobiales bacterium]PCJ94298.1 MAG: hypothetical protein COA52_05395 [Hyphomicrobiales bacterium]